jgi:hypothetical protein
MKEGKAEKRNFLLTFYHVVGFLGVINVPLVEDAAMRDPFARPLNLLHF